MKFYHASKRRYRVGDIIHGTVQNSCARTAVVYLTTSPVPHYTIAIDAEEQGWHVYQVEPLGKVQYCRDWQEYHARAVRVVRYVGNARGIMRNAYPHWREKKYGWIKSGGQWRRVGISSIGSVAEPAENN